MLVEKRRWFAFIFTWLAISPSLFGLSMVIMSLKQSSSLLQFSGTNTSEIISIEGNQITSDSSDGSFNPRITHPWKQDPSCQRVTIQMAKQNSLPKRALTSFPGSGVTWLRQMIEGLTGIYTGSIHKRDSLPFRDHNDENMGITDDPSCGCTIIDKDHEATEGVFQRGYYLKRLKEHSHIIETTYNYRGILLLRNPMDVVFAHQNHLLVGKFNVAPLEAFRGPEWDELVDTVAFAWADHAVRWIERIKQGTVVFYENFLGGSAHLELERLLDAIDFHPSLVEPNRMRCVLAHRNESEYKRRKKPRFALEKRHRHQLMQSIHKVQHSLRQRKWPQLPVHLYDMHLPAEEEL